MKKLILFCGICVFILKSLSAQDSLLNKSRTHDIGLLFYAEVYGHNYYGFQSKQAKGIVSINLAYRQTIIKKTMYLMVSAGWGTFKERHSTQIPNQPREYFYDRISFLPLEATAQIGKMSHFFELGYCYTLAWGDHELVYFGSQATAQSVMINKGSQAILRIGYAYFGQDGLVVRLSYTPHFIPRSYNFFSEYSVNKPNWVPLGLSIGYHF